MSPTPLIRPESRDYHRKAQQNVRLSEFGAAAVRALSAFYGVGISGVVEMLVRERVYEKGIRVDLKSRSQSAKRRKR